MSNLVRRAVAKLGRVWFRLRYGRQFAQLGANSFLHPPFRLDGAGGVTVGTGSVWHRGDWLYCVGRNDGSAALKVDDGCVFGYNNHFTAVESVVIGGHVLTADNAYISDNQHAYEDIDVPVMHQPVKVRGLVRGGDGCWLGDSVAAMEASNGRIYVIGANAVVTEEIPDYSVSVSIPAKVILSYDKTSERWISLAGNVQT